jgi:hypothetical protein
MRYVDATNFTEHVKCYSPSSCLRNQRCMYGKLNADKEWENCFTPSSSEQASTPTGGTRDE